MIPSSLPFTCITIPLGDTMHMARVWDSSRDRAEGAGGTGYSLETLSAELLNKQEFQKISMKDIFGQSKPLKDGSASKVKVLPSMRELQESPDTRQLWIEYSARDAFATHGIYESLKSKLQAERWLLEGDKNQDKGKP